jgi:hypothetical protein
MARFLPGQSGNPGGKPLSAMRDLAMRHEIGTPLGDVEWSDLPALAATGDPLALLLLKARERQTHAEGTDLL